MCEKKFTPKIVKRTLDKRGRPTGGAKVLGDGEIKQTYCYSGSDNLLGLLETAAKDSIPLTVDLVRGGIVGIRARGK